jgi:hypothetical protein
MQWALVDTHFVETAAQSRRGLRTKKRQYHDGSGHLSAMSCPLQMVLVDTHFVETAARSRRRQRTKKRQYHDDSGEPAAMS